MAAKTGDRKGRLKGTALKDSENEENRQETYTRAVTQLWLHERRTLSAKWKLEWRRVTRKKGGYRRAEKTRMEVPEESGKRKDLLMDLGRWQRSR